EETQDNTYIECSWVVDTVLNRELYLAFQIVDYVLLSAPGAPLKEKLLRSGICSDVMSSYENGVLQPYFSIMIKNTNASEKERFVSMVRETLEEIVEKGVDKKSLEAGINYFEFKYREADFGAYPKGLMYGLQCLDSWLYDDKDPFMHISATETIEFLKEKAATGYFEEIIRKYLIDNNHSAVIVSVPRKGLTAKKEAALASKMEEYKAGLSDTQIKELAKKTAALKKYQEEPSTPEELASIPMLKVSDIEKKAKPIDNELIEKDGVRYLYHAVNTNGISYLTLLFDIRSIPMELACYAALLRSLYGMVSTERYSYFDLANEINSKTGGITVTQSVYNREDMIVPAIEVDAKMLMDMTDFAFDMIEEIIFFSKLDEYVRIKEMLQMMKSRMQMAMLSSGHSMASKRAMGYFSDSSLYEDMTGGYEFYRFIDGLLEDFDNKKQELTEKFTQVIPMIFGRDNLIVSIGGSREALKKVMDRIPAFMEKLSDAPHPATKIELPHEKKNEGFKSSSMVQYAAMAGNFKAAGLEYNGALRVLKTILGYDYLWINVRVKGGAYGCMSGFGRNGDSFMVSYRDPNIGKTYYVYKNAASYVENFDASDRDMSKYIIGTMAVVDTPLTPKMRCDRGLAQFVVGRSFESIQKERDEILSTDKETVRSLAPYVRALTDPGYICVVGGEERINEEKELFNKVKNLF
ncbi:MAG: insulinase family protein, partial [Lachnospiraceae bacterium]|nr:insulinase family protein [Lachnospiraceae bacterium]